jgi:hypothetical protein
MRIRDIILLIGQATLMLAWLFALIYGLALLEGPAVAIRQDVTDSIQDFIEFRNTISNPTREEQ